MPKTAGILDIIAGAFFPLEALIYSLCIFFNFRDPPAVNICDFELPMIVFIIICLILNTLLSILAIVGGVYALRKRIWGLALAGSIAATMSFSLLGIPALVFTIKAKKQFK